VCVYIYIYIYECTQTRPTTAVAAIVEVRGGGSTGRFIPSPREWCYSYCCCRCSDTAEKWGGKNHWTTSNALSNSWASTSLPTVTSTPRSLKLGVFTTVASDLLFVYFLLIYIYVYNNIHIFLIFFWSRRNVFFITHGAAARDLEANIICIYARVYGVGYANRIRMMYTRSIIM